MKNKIAITISLLLFLFSLTGCQQNQNVNIAKQSDPIPCSLIVPTYDNFNDLPEGFSRIIVLNSQYAEENKIQLKIIEDRFQFYNVIYKYDNNMIQLTTRNDGDQKYYQQILDNGKNMHIAGRDCTKLNYIAIIGYAWVDGDQLIIIELSKDLENSSETIINNLEWLYEN